MPQRIVLHAKPFSVHCLLFLFQILIYLGISILSLIKLIGCQEILTLHRKSCKLFYFTLVCLNLGVLTTSASLSIDQVILDVRVGLITFTLTLY